MHHSLEVLGVLAGFGLMALALPLLYVAHLAASTGLGQRGLTGRAAIIALVALAPHSVFSGVRAVYLSAVASDSWAFIQVTPLLSHAAACAVLMYCVHAPNRGWNSCVKLD